MTRRTLLRCGILAPLLYGLADALAGARWAEYSFRDQTISELGALGAPSRPLFAALLVLTYVLLVAFGVGVRRSAGPRHGVRAAGGFIVGFGALALTVGQLASMRPRGTEQGLSGALHLVEGGVAMVLVLAAMGLAASALGGRFRRYTIATIIVMLAFGAWSATDAPRIEAGLPTPWVGVRERIFWYAYQAWFLVLSVVLLREGARPMETQPTESRRKGHP